MLAGKYKRRITNPFSTHEKAQFWHPTLNGDVTPEDIADNSAKLFYFKCPTCSHDICVKIWDITRRNRWCGYCSNRYLCGEKDCECCFKKSFASHPKAKFWDYEKNNDLPINVSLGSEKKRYFNCPNCPHNISMMVKRVSRGEWCGYCSNRYLCGEKDCDFCFKKSFALHPKAEFWDYEKNKDLPINVSIGSNKKRYFNCPNCPHSFLGIPKHIVNGVWCNFCSNRNLCGEKDCEFCLKKSFALHPKAEFWDYEKNNDLPFNVSLCSDKKRSFICNICNKSFKKAIHSITKQHSWCSCIINKTEHKTFQFLNNNTKKYFIKELKIHYKPIWCNLRKTHKTYYEFDIYIELINGVKIIIEIDGPQHFVQVSNWAIPRYTQIRDEIKQRLAGKNEHNLIRVNQEDIWHDKNNWEDDIIGFINEKYKNNDEIEIYDCVGGERYYKN